MSYGFRIIYHSSIFSDKIVFEVDGCDSFQQAKLECKKFAELFGWRNPRWYEFWRWKDTKLFT